LDGEMIVEEMVKTLYSDFICMFSENDANHADKGSKTQTAEIFYINLFELILEDLKSKRGTQYKKASSQHPYDFRVLCNNSKSTYDFTQMMDSVDNKNCLNVDLINDLLLLEIKQAKSGTFILNDTLPSNESWYILFYNRKPTKLDPNKYMYLIRGSCIKEAMNAELKSRKSILDLENYISEAKQLRNNTGNTYYTRLNLQVRSKYIDEFVDDIHCFKREISSGSPYKKTKKKSFDEQLDELEKYVRTHSFNKG
jgi:hypothetical protein